MEMDAEKTECEVCKGLRTLIQEPWFKEAVSRKLVGLCVNITKADVDALETLAVVRKCHGTEPPL